MVVPEHNSLNERTRLGGEDGCFVEVGIDAMVMEQPLAAMGLVFGAGQLAYKLLSLLLLLLLLGEDCPGSWSSVILASCWSIAFSVRQAKH